jgi:hypothetical protein
MQIDQILCSAKGEAELESLDRRAGHQYIPMDVYITPGTMREHFQASSIRSRWIRMRQTSS